ncbi:hypothetical protein K431DRAFT_313326 [Polychaeton citri CBS 116435]|uniref:PCI domain-containing protein n=1 Tax=Polychaeton citri CBS 116435 TaxID=1314669 RepID=A0A9P4Q721_9PEZI|nr:hypothetical protein K431DRAFT_313326 [Polychaeton citri CBS 116435]
MDQSRAINALEPFLALAKSATSPRAAADLITQATSAPNTYVFAELLQQPNIQQLARQEQYGSHYTQLQMFAWGTWESYHATPNLPELSSTQQLKLRLLSLLTISSEKPSASSKQHHLSYSSLSSRLDLRSAIDLEHLVTQAIYENLITATLNPADQTVVITSVAPLRDLAPGSVQTLVSELAAWGGRCDTVLSDLEAEIAKVKADAVKRAAREAKADRQIKAATEVEAKGMPTRGINKKEEDGEDGDAMEIDSGSALGTGGGKKRGSSTLGHVLGKLGRRPG